MGLCYFFRKGVAQFSARKVLKPYLTDTWVACSYPKWASSSGWRMTSGLASYFSSSYGFVGFIFTTLGNGYFFKLVHKSIFLILLISCYFCLSKLEVPKYPNYFFARLITVFWDERKIPVDICRRCLYQSVRSSSFLTLSFSITSPIF